MTLSKQTIAAIEKFKQFCDLDADLSREIDPNATLWQELYDTAYDLILTDLGEDSDTEAEEILENAQFE
jgi:hypothetical protein